MRNVYKASLSVIFMMAILCGCSETIGDKLTESTGWDIILSIDINDITSVRSGDESSPCLDSEELMALVQSGQLKMKLTGKGIDGSSFTTSETSLTYQSGRLISSPVSIALDNESDQCVEISQITVLNTLTKEVLYSSMNHTSDYAGLVDEDCLLSKSICYDHDMRDRKTTFEVCVFCAHNLSPDVFGYLKWNLDIKNVMYIPFEVSVCDNDHQPVTGDGVLYIKSGMMLDGTFVSDKSDYTPVSFPDINGGKCYFQFADDLSVDDDQECYMYIMTVGDHIYSGVATVSRLLEYEHSGIWDEVSSRLRFNFCDSGQSWFMLEYPDQCNPLLKYSVVSDYGKTSHLFFYYDSNELKIDGLPTYQTPDGSTSSCYIYKNSAFCLQNLVEFDDNSDNLGFQSFIQVYLFDKSGRPGDLTLEFYKDDGSFAGTTCVTPVLINGLDTYTCSVKFAETGIACGCYRLKIIPSSGIYFQSLNIYRIPFAD